MLNVDRLRALQAVALHGSIYAAANALHVTPSAISQQIAKLETDVGHQLLERQGRGIRVTDAASVLVDHARRAISVLEQAEAELDARRTAVAGPLAVAAFPTAARGLVPGAFARLHAQHPLLHATLRELEVSESVPLLVRRDVDLVIAHDWINAPLALPDGLQKAPLLDDLVDIALPRGHRLAKRASVRLDELAYEPWISCEPGSICGDWLLHALRSRDHEPRVAHTAAEHATQLALVAAGLGAAVIPRLGRESIPAGVCVRPVTPTLHRHVYAVWRVDATRRTAIQAAVLAFREIATATAAASSAGAKSSRARLRSQPVIVRRRAIG